MSHLAIRCFGALDVRRGNREISTFRAAKNEALLAYLAVESDRAHKRARLAGMLWPEHDEQTARQNLRQSLFRLRSLLNRDDDPVIVTDRRTARFNRECDHRLDVTTFTTLLHGCADHAHPARSACAPCAARLTEAVALYRDDFLAGLFLEESVAMEEWILLTRERLRHDLLEALADLVRFHQERGATEQTLAYARRRVALDPLGEEGRRQLMAVLAQAGRATEALAEFAECRRLLDAELGVEPAAETVALAQAIRVGRATLPAVPAAPPRHNLPAMPTKLIGRHAELAQLRARLTDPEEQLVSLVGEGGVGKSRLAHAAALALVDHFRDGVRFAPLAHVGGATPTALEDGLVTALAQAVGLALQGPDDPHTQLIHYLSSKEMLLLLDNLEHLLPAVGLLGRLLQEAPRLTLLVTSRERLNLQAERVIRVAGLPVPAADDPDADAVTSVQLFVDRANQTALEFTLTPETLPHVVAICRLVEGLPLAIELAASWVEQFTPGEIAAAIGENVDFLTGAMRDLPPRHRSLRATFDHSWRLLSPKEQSVLAQCAVFRETWSRDAALAVTDAGLTDLVSLVNKSLVQVAAPGRYTLHALVRQLAAEKLAASPAREEAARARHGRFYLDLPAGRQAHLLGREQADALAMLDRERHNLRAAWRWAAAHVETAALARAADSLQMLYEIRNDFREGEALFADAAQMVAQAAPGPARDGLQGRLLAGQGFFVFSQGRYADGAALFAQSLELLRAVDDRAEQARTLGYLGLVQERMGAYAEATALQQESLALYRALDDRRGTANALRLLAGAAEGLGAYARAADLLQESLTLYAETGDRRGAALALNLLGIVTEMQGAYDAARRHYGESLALFTELDDRWGMQLPLGNLGDVAFTLGDYDAAKRYYGRALAILQTSWAVPYMLIQIYRMAAVLAIEGRPREAAALLALPLHHPSLDQAFRERAQALHATLAEQLAPADLAAAMARPIALEEAVRRVTALAGEGTDARQGRS